MADDFLSINILGERALTRNLDQMPDIVRVLLRNKIELFTQSVADKVRSNISSRLKGDGKLLAAVEVKVPSSDRDTRIEGSVSINPSVRYAYIQEKGGVTPPHQILPKNSKVLAFRAATGDKVFALRVMHPGAQIEGKHYMADAYREMGPEISRGIKNAVIQGIRAHMRGTS